MKAPNADTKNMCQNNLITTADALPAEVLNTDSYIPTSNGNDLIHPYNPDTQQWAEHCNYCGTYVQDTPNLPPTDALCDSCNE